MKYVILAALSFLLGYYFNYRRWLISGRLYTMAKKVYIENYHLQKENDELKRVIVNEVEEV